jgi:hypothetical protein
MRHVEAIAAEPRPQGSAAAREARDYIFAELELLGLSPEIQDAAVVRVQDDAPFVQAGDVENVVVRIPGTDSTGAILLGAHYDSGPGALGAGDCGACVAAVLETIRAVLEGEPLRNDLIVLFPDAEETLLGGSYVFMEEHAWAADVRASLNLEAQGRKGGSLFYFSGSEDGDLESIVLDEARHPFANSLMPILVRSFVGGSDGDNYTDSGVPGVGFAFFFDGQYYHTLGDNVANLSRGSLQHHGDYTLPVIRELGGRDLSVLGDSSSTVFFNILPNRVIQYSGNLAPPMALLLTLGFIGLGVMGHRRGALTVRGSLFGVAVVFGSLVAVILVVTVLWLLIRLLNTDYHIFMVNVTYQDQTYLWAFTGLSLSLVSGLVFLAGRKTRGENLIGGALFWWWLLTVLTAVAAPPASALFMWPFTVALLVGGWMLYKPEMTERAWPRLFAAALVIVPSILIVLPTVHLIAVISGRAESLAGIPLVAVPAVIAALAFALTVPFLGAVNSKKPWILPASVGLLSLAVIGWANATSGFDAEHPKPNMIMYALDADTGEASWQTTSDSSLGRGRSGQIDEWTSQFLGDEPTETEVLPWIALFEGGTPGYEAEAPAVDFDAPLVEVVGSSALGTGRVVRLNVSSPRGALNATIEVKTGVEAASLDDRTIEVEKLMDNDELLRIVYYALPSDGFELALTLATNEPFDIEVNDWTAGLPEISGFQYEARPDHMIPAVFDLTDTTRVTKTYTISD